MDPQGMVPTTKVATTALLPLLNTLGRSRSTEDSKSPPMVQGIKPIKANNSSRITRTSIATMGHRKASRRDITKATTLPTQIPTTLLAAAEEDQTTTTKVNSVYSSWVVGVVKALKTLLA